MAAANMNINTISIFSQQISKHNPWFMEHCTLINIIKIIHIYCVHEIRGRLYDPILFGLEQSIQFHGVEGQQHSNEKGKKSWNNVFHHIVFDCNTACSRVFHCTCAAASNFNPQY